MQKTNVTHQRKFPGWNDWIALHVWKIGLLWALIPLQPSLPGGALPGRCC